ncbi:MAG: pseudouridine synthase [Bacteroidia bacterium]
MPHYFQIYKPYGVLSQFTTESPEKKTLKRLFDFPPDVYPIGRLDEDSEGLLFLTDDKRLNQQYLGQGFEKEYWVQVEGQPSENDLAHLRQGVSIRVRKKSYTTLAAEVTILAADPPLPDREPPIRVRQAIPTTWLSITLREGKNRQVRKMTAKIGFPTLRLVRWRFDRWTINDFAVGEVRKWDR